MRIGIFPVMAGRKAAGLETYECDLIRSLTTFDRQNEYHIFCADRAAVNAIRPLDGRAVFHILKPSFRWLSFVTSLPVEIMRSRIDLLHATFVPPPLSPSEYVFTMHDISMFTHPEYYPKAHLWRVQKLVLKGVRKARLLLCVSKHTRDLVSDYFNIPHEKLSVVYNGVRDNFYPVKIDSARSLIKIKYGIYQPYVLFVGQLRTAAKNLIRIFEAFNLFKKEVKRDCKLVLVGRRGWTAHGIDENIERLQLKEDIVELGHINDQDLPAFYSAAELLLFPSLNEGFGLPVIEAMACGCPVVTSDISCLPEIAGGAAVLVDPYAVRDIAKGMFKLLYPSKERESFIEKGLNRAKLFTWEKTAQQTLDAYNKALQLK